ncbi:NUDIX domain-containing protein [Candidatus Saccharibacteria bacterium]|nr:NUDIX domain-containing protein [Candidatus Saccharibacteria bacterium]
MSLEINIHDAQMVILRELLFHPSVSFAKLQKITGMSSDHFNFHLQKLVELKLVEKVSRGTYSLSPRGKEYANKLDTDSNTVERQPKTAVILAVERLKKDGTKEYLFQERLKQPYFGFWGFATGKVRWGETITQTAERELLEETGLYADHRVAGVYHELVYQQETGEQLEDKIFFVVHCTNTKGKLLEEFEGGRNSWMTREDASAQPKIFTSFNIEIDIVTSDETFIEHRVEYTKDLF